MLTPMTISTRDILRKHKEVFAHVQETKQPTVVVSQHEPQVAIVSLEDLERLEQLRYRDAVRGLQVAVKRVRELLKDEHLPRDLAGRHDDYLWPEEGTP